ncbi:MAG: Cell-division control histidine kinase PdhS, partial [Candidatus Anoxychlamydiales bacterium]|nr:Cell-division control histidine kinase PdhS [Candidatus Anoxychlamydiales bacterium]
MIDSKLNTVSPSEYKRLKSLLRDPKDIEEIVSIMEQKVIELSKSKNSKTEDLKSIEFKKAELKLQEAAKKLKEVKEKLENKIGVRTYALRERIKELTCLYRISQLAEKVDISIQDLLKESLDLIRSAWQFPNITCVRIQFKDLKIKTDDFLISKWKQEAPIRRSNEIIGKIEVYYKKKKPNSYEGPFLKEERSLINAIAEVIGRFAERKKIKQNLEESVEKYRNLVNNVSDIIIETDLEGNRTFVNPQISKITGYGLEESILKNKFDLMHPDDREKVKRAIGIALINKSVVNVEYRTRHKDGYYIPMLARGMVIDTKGTLKIIFIISDITEIKKARDLIIEENKKLEELNKIKRSLIIRVSHELKTPLNSILGASHILMNYHKDNMNKEILEYHEIIRKGSLRLKTLIDDLLDISRLDNDKFELKKKKENLIDLIKDSVFENKLIADRRKITVESNLPERIILEIDKIRIEQVITNILTNAIKYTPPRGSVYLSLAENDDYVEIFIKDTGIGLTNQEKLQLFTKFGKIERYGKKFDVDIEG